MQILFTFRAVYATHLKLVHVFTLRQKVINANVDIGRCLNGIEHNRAMRNDLISRGGYIPWPARSPDLSACGYFLWGVSKVTFSSLSLEPSRD
jgi:hypothetical protein